MQCDEIKYSSKLSNKDMSFMGQILTTDINGKAN
jgi:hypothetical protein